jgi:hypothetical protein
MAVNCAAHMVQINVMCGLNAVILVLNVTVRIVWSHFTGMSESGVDKGSSLVAFRRVDR